MKKLLPLITILACCLLFFGCKHQSGAKAATLGNATTIGASQMPTTESDADSTENENTEAVELSPEPYKAHTKPKGLTFTVSDVEMPKKMLPVFKPKAVMEQRIGKQISYYSDEKTGINLVFRDNNGLVQTIHESYATHRPLVLSPDAVWLTICQGVSIHINQHFDSLEHIVFKKDKPKEIRVRNDSLETSSTSWAKLAEGFANETKPYTNGDLYSVFVPSFATTTPTIRAAYHVTMLECFKQAFTYVGESGCGIPNITLTGTKQDWEWMYNHVDTFRKFGLGTWVDNLKPILKEFVNAFDGNINKSFWQAIYKDASEYGAYYLSGWVVKLFPYIEQNNEDGTYDQQTGTTKVGKRYIPNPYIDGDRYLLSTLTTESFPSGFAQIDVVWENYFKNETSNMEFYAGFFGIRQYSDMSLEPNISWAVCDKKARRTNYDFPYGEMEEQKHPNEFGWYPLVQDKPDKPAIYHPEQNKTATEGLTELKKELLENLHKETGNSSYDNVSVIFVVTGAGSVTDVKISGTKDDKALRCINRSLKSSTYTWQAAVCPISIMDLMDADDSTLKQTFNVNSSVSIKLKE